MPEMFFKFEWLLGICRGKFTVFGTSLIFLPCLKPVIYILNFTSVLIQRNKVCLSGHFEASPYMNSEEGRNRLSRFRHSLAESGWQSPQFLARSLLYAVIAKPCGV